jgi:hypothetical protein
MQRPAIPPALSLASIGATPADDVREPVVPDNEPEPRDRIRKRLGSDLRPDYLT